jgi:hypothetical protein
MLAKIFSTIIIVTVCYTTLIAQQTIPRVKHIFKITPTHMWEPDPHVNIAYEYRMANNKAVQLELGYIFKYDILGNFDYGSLFTSSGGFVMRPSYKWYKKLDKKIQTYTAIEPTIKYVRGKGFVDDAALYWQGPLRASTVQKFVFAAHVQKGAFIIVNKNFAFEVYAAIGVRYRQLWDGGIAKTNIPSISSSILPNLINKPFLPSGKLGVKFDIFW